MADNDHNDGNVTPLPSALDRIGQPAPAGEQEFDPSSKEYEAEWPLPKIRGQEVEVVFWDKHGNFRAIPYPSMEDLTYIDGVITFTYNRKNFTLKGFNLVGLGVGLAFKRLQHVREYNPDYHETSKDELRARGKPCIEQIIIEEE